MTPLSTFDLSDISMLLAAEDSIVVPVWARLLIVASVLIIPFVLGNLIAKSMKMKDLGTRIGVTLFAITLGLSPFIFRMATDDPDDPDDGWKSAIKLGIDLAGGTNLVYQVDRAAAASSGKEVNGETMDKLVGAIIRRINPSGTEEVTVRRVGQDRVEVIIPGAEQEVVEQKKRQMTQLGSLEFAILANRNDHKQIIDLATSEANKGKSEIYSGTDIVAKWRPVGIGKHPESGEVYTKDISTHGDVVTREGKDEDGDPITEFLLVVDKDRDQWLTGEYLKSARETISNSGPVVSFTFNSDGGYLMQRLTSRYQPKKGSGFMRRLAVLLDEKVHSAPNIKGVISTQGQIDGQFSREELDELINVLNAGALEVPLVQNPISEFTVSPLLGADVQEKGMWAIIIAGMAVFVFMLVYYMIAGAVADVCLLINIILVLGIMSLINATFTLPGLAGLVLTIGMAVDANVLIFERMREEKDKGSSLRMSIKNGFGKALTTIVDANVTTLITAVVLYMIGTDQVRGFAVTLFVGIVMSMFTALFVGRLIFDILERKKLIKDLKMLRIVGESHWDFLGKRTIAALCSGLLIAAGLTSVFARGSDNLDIDFRGGSMVTFEFADGSEVPTVDQARDLLAQKFESNISLERLQLEEASGKEDVLYRLRTTEQEADKVSAQVADAFAGSSYDLIKQSMQIGATSEIPAATDGPGDDFSGGNETKLTFTQPVTATTVVDDVIDQVRKIPGADDAPKYDQPRSLIAAFIDGDLEADETLKANDFVVRASPVIEQADLQSALTSLETSLGSKPLFQEKNTFDSSVAGDTQRDAVAAMLCSLVFIVAYIWIRFQRVTFGLAAVAALVHDVLIVLGMVALASYASGNSLGEALGLVDFKINLPMIAAFLTIVGYSLNDTIVVFDRIREVRGKNPALTSAMINESLNQTLSRTLLTSITTFIVVLILYAVGGEGIHGFAFCLLLGVIVGTYSSIYVASPVLLYLMNRGTKPSTSTA